MLLSSRPLEWSHVTSPNRGAGVALTASGLRYRRLRSRFRPLSRHTPIKMARANQILLNLRGCANWCRATIHALGLADATAIRWSRLCCGPPVNSPAPSEYRELASAFRSLASRFAVRMPLNYDAQPHHLDVSECQQSG